MMATMPIPNMNPTGAVGAGNFNGAAFPAPAGVTAMPGTGGPGTVNFGNTMNTMPQTSGVSGGAALPIAKSAGGPTVGQNPGMPAGTGTVTSEGSTTPSQNPYGLSGSQMNWMEKYLQETYGGGMGALVYQYLMSNGGYNSSVTQQSIDAQINSMGQQTQQGANSLAGMMGQAGVSSASSGYGQSLAQYFNQATAQENSITAQEYYNMWNQSQQNELQMMEFAAQGTGTTLANKPNAMDYLSAGLGAAGSLVGMGTGIANAGSLATIAGSL
jgi:hypothetical protein